MFVNYLTEECGHITVPDGVNTPNVVIIQGVQRATLACSKEGYVFAGEKDPTTQLCIKGEWTYQALEYEIPSCQGIVFTQILNIIITQVYVVSEFGHKTKWRTLLKHEI